MANIHNTAHVEHYLKNKKRLDADAKRAIEAGSFKGFPEGFDVDTYAKHVVTVLDKFPAAATGDVHPNGKPLSASEKRARKRREQEKPPMEVVDVTLNEDQYKVISKEDYVPPPQPQYIKHGKKMPEGWTPIEMDDCKPEPIETTQCVGAN